MWDGQFKVLSRQLRVIRYDLRGYGRSPMTEVPFAHHEDLRGLLAERRVDRAYLVGVSLGALTALHLALEHPEMIRGLVLVGSGLSGYRFTDAATTGQWPAIDQALQRVDFSLAAELQLRLWVDGPSRLPGDVPTAVRDRVREMMIERYATLKRSTVQPLQEAASRLADIRTPTLILVGELDVPDIHRIAKLLTTGIQGARCVTIPGTAHLPNMEQPEEFNRLILDFMKQVA